MSPVRYWLRGEPQPFDTRNMSIHYLQREPEQYLGLPWLAPVLPNVFDNQQFRADKMLQARLVTRMGLWTHKKGRTELLDALTNDPESDENPYIAFESGNIYSSEEKPEAIKLPDDLAIAYPMLVKWMILEVAIGMGFSYQLLTSDLEGMNFASSRANKIADSRFFNFLRRFFVKTCAHPKYAKFVEWEILMGKIPGVSFTDYLNDPYMWNRCEWQGDGDDWVDPLKDAETRKLERNLGMVTYRDICSMVGKNSADVMRQLSKEKEELTAAGLTELIPLGMAAEAKGGLAAAAAGSSPASDTANPDAVTNADATGEG
jgi:capsid protein